MREREGRYRYRDYLDAAEAELREGKVH